MKKTYKTPQTSIVELQRPVCSIGLGSGTADDADARSSDISFTEDNEYSSND